VAGHLLMEPPQFQRDGEQLLPDAVVEIALKATALLIHRQHQACSGALQLINCARTCAVSRALCNARRLAAAAAFSSSGSFNSARS
jgi:hypothetical protein